MKRTVVRLTLVACLATAGTVVLPALPAAAFTGHNCTIATCRFFTSSYYTTRFYYDRTTCGGWRSLSRVYLHGFRTRAGLLSRFPNRRLHAPC